MDEGPSEVGGYRLLRHLGQGGFGSVYLGESPDGRRAAVKLLHVAPGGNEAEFRATGPRRHRPDVVETVTG
jgi:serine/threonine protein kinase